MVLKDSDLDLDPLTFGDLDNRFNKQWVFGDTLCDQQNAFWDTQSLTEVVATTFSDEVLKLSV